ncbi:Methyltransferase type 11 [Thiocapsa sp. KS1]|nr:Methyltransferase type 11 [Thiocapsa sp. KS1]
MSNPAGEPSRPTPDPWHGADYAHHSGLQAAMADEVLAQMQLLGDEQVLDLGCGDGKISARIAAQLVQGAVLGVDASADMVAYAQRQFGADRCPNLRFEVADARRLGFEACFDLVVSFNALHWVPQAADALRGIRRALKPEGLARLRLVTRAALVSLEEVAEEVRREPHWAGAFAGFSDPYLRLSAEEYAALAESLGLKQLSLCSAAKRWDFRTEDAFFGFCNAGFGAWTRRLPEARRRAFVEESMARYLAAIDGTFGERFVFHFTQTDLVLAPAGSATSVD